MPYELQKSKRGKGKSRFKRVANAVKSGVNLASTAMKAYKIAKSVAAVINVEKKYFDVTASAAISSTAVITPLSLITQGDSYNNRDGNSVKLQSHFIRFHFLLNAASNNSTIRFMVVQDREYPNGTAVAIGQLIENTSGGATSIVSPALHTTGRRFNVLLDKQVMLSTGSEWCNVYEQYLPIGNHIHYSDTNPNTTTDTREGQLYVVLFSDQTTNTPTVTYYSRLRFVDN